MLRNSRSKLAQCGEALHNSRKDALNWAGCRGRLLTFFCLPWLSYCWCVPLLSSPCMPLTQDVWNTASSSSYRTNAWHAWTHQAPVVSEGITPLSCCVTTLGWDGAKNGYRYMCIVCDYLPMQIYSMYSVYISYKFFVSSSSYIWTLNLNRGTLSKGELSGEGNSQ